MQGFQEDLRRRVSLHGYLSSQFILTQAHSWRQSGIIAAACDYALDHHLPDIGRDHVAAQELAKALQALGFSIFKPVDSNMVWLDVGPGGITNGDGLNEFMLEKGFKIRTPGAKGTMMRLVIHRQNNSKVGELAAAFAEFQKVFKAGN